MHSQGLELIGLLRLFLRRKSPLILWVTINTMNSGQTFDWKGSDAPPVPDQISSEILS